MTTMHLPKVDYPLTNQILVALLKDRAHYGYFLVNDGVDVNWNALENSGLSTTEQGTVIIALGIALIEGRGGFPGDESVAIAVEQAVRALR